MGPPGLQKLQASSKPEDFGDIPGDAYWEMCLEPCEEQELPAIRKLAADTKESAVVEEMSEDEAALLRQIGALPQKSCEQ